METWIRCEGGQGGGGGGQEWLQLVEQLTKAGFKAAAMHGDMDQV